MTKTSHLSLVPPPLAEKELFIDYDALHEGTRTYEEMAVKRGFDVARRNGNYVEPSTAVFFDCFLRAWASAWMRYAHLPAPAPAPALHVVPVPGSDLV